MSKQDYCGIVFIGGGSSHAWAATPEAAAQQAAKTCKQDWSGLFKFKKRQEFKVCVYDMRKHSGWYADHSGVYSSDTNKKLPLLELKKVTV